MSYYDAAEVLLQTMRFVWNSTIGVGAEFEYPVIAVNGIGDGVRPTVPDESAAPDIDRTDEEWFGLADEVSPAIPSGVP